MNDSSTAPFLIGITGHMDLQKDEVPRLKKQVRLLFRFLKLGAKHADPEHQDNTLLDSLVAYLPLPASQSSADAETYRSALAHWTGLHDTPVVVLSSLAPGADTVVAEVARDEQFQQLGFSVRAPLPFPDELYRDASTFVRSQPGNPDSEDARRQADYDELIRQIGAENTFPVILQEDLRRSDQALRKQFQEDRDIQARRRRRYRAAGEYVAGHANLLFAIWDEHHDSD